MPRISKTRGKTSTYRGISSHKVCILSALDDFDQCIFLVQGLGVETTERANQLLDYISEEQMENTTFTTDMKQIYDGVVSKINKTHIEIKSEAHVDENGNSLSSINQLHSEFLLLFRRYHGISTRHLQGYLDFFSYCKNLNYRILKTKDKMLHAYKSLNKEMSTLRVRDICKIDLPIDLFEAYGDWNYGCFSA